MKPFFAYLGRWGTERVRVVSEALHNPDFVIIERMDMDPLDHLRLTYAYKDSVFITDPVMNEGRVKAFPRYGWSELQKRYG